MIQDIDSPIEGTAQSVAEIRKTTIRVIPTPNAIRPMEMLSPMDPNRIAAAILPTNRMMVDASSEPLRRFGLTSN